MENYKVLDPKIGQGKSLQIGFIILWNKVKSFFDIMKITGIGLVTIRNRFCDIKIGVDWQFLAKQFQLFELFRILTKPSSSWLTSKKIIHSLFSVYR